MRAIRISVTVLSVVSIACRPANPPDIHDAARGGDVEAVRNVLEKHPDLLDARDVNGMTPLHWAARGVHPEVVSYLVKLGADVTIEDANGVIPLHSLAYRGATELAALMVEIGADVNSQISNGSAPIHFAVQGGHDETVGRLIALGADLDVEDGFGNSPLLLASSYGLEAIVEILLEADAGVDLRNRRGDTALTVAHREGHIAIFDRLVASGADASLAEDFRIPGGPYLGQDPPGTTPAVFAPRIVSTERAQLNAVFSPDGTEFYFTQRTPGGSTIMVMRMENSGWSRPNAAAFSGNHADVDHFMTGDGMEMFFCSTRPIAAGAEAKQDADIWVSARTPDGWAEAKHLGSPVNSPENDYYPTLADDGTLYFSSRRSGGLGESDIYRSASMNGAFATPENLGPAVNTRFLEFDPFVSPDQTYLIWASERPGGLGSSDLYISFRTSDGSWSKARNMGSSINSAESDFTPMLSPDGKFLFFTSRRSGASDVYWVDAGVINQLRP